jgi:hypothetical protein
VLAGINGIKALLAGTDACAQQNNTDAMVDISQLRGIRLWSRFENAVTYRKHPCNTLNNSGVVPRRFSAKLRLGGFVHKREG